MLSKNGFEHDVFSFRKMLILMRFAIRDECYGRDKEGMMRWVLGGKYDLLLKAKEPWTDVRGMLQDDIDWMLKYMRVRCFCKDNKNRLMWAHYAGNFTGFCIEYDIEKLTLTLENGLTIPYGLFPVQYLRSRVMVNMLELGKTTTYSDILFCVLKAMLCKHEDWAKEEEWRLFLYLLSSDVDVFARPSAVYIGLESNKVGAKKRRTRLIKALTRQCIPIHYLKTDPYSYELSFVPHP